MQIIKYYDEEEHIVFVCIVFSKYCVSTCELLWLLLFQMIMSMAWTTPLVASISSWRRRALLSTLEATLITPALNTCVCTFSPESEECVIHDMPFVNSVPFSMHRSSVFFSISLSAISASSSDDGITSKAESIGAKSVNGPGPDTSDDSPVDSNADRRRLKGRREMIESFSFAF